MSRRSSITSNSSSSSRRSHSLPQFESVWNQIERDAYATFTRHLIQQNLMPASTILASLDLTDSEADQLAEDRLRSAFQPMRVDQDLQEHLDNIRQRIEPDVQQAIDEQGLPPPYEESPTIPSPLPDLEQRARDRRRRAFSRRRRSPSPPPQSARERSNEFADRVETVSIILGGVQINGISSISIDSMEIRLGLARPTPGNRTTQPSTM